MYFCWLLLPPVNEVWGKVMFLHMSVILSTGGSLHDVPSCLAAWSHVTSWGSLSLVPCSFQGVSVPDPMFVPDGVSVKGGVYVKRGSLSR